MKLHHLGIVVKNLEDYVEKNNTFFSLEKKSDIFEDYIQNVKIQLIGDENSFLLEIIEPLNESSPVSKFLIRGGGFYHLCYEVEKLDKSINKLISIGGIVVKGPNPAVAFNHRFVAFLLLKDIGLVELLEEA